MNLRLFIPIFFILLISCRNKENDPTPPTSPSAPASPQITITNPANNSHFVQNETVDIAASITDDHEIYTITLQIKNLGDNSIVTLINGAHIHQPSYTLNTSYGISIPDPGNYQIIIIVTDLDGNSSQKTLNYSIN